MVAAAAGYLVLVVAARTLSPAENAQFLVFWSTLFGLFGVLGGVQQESTRAVGSTAVAVGSPPGARVLPVSLGIGVGLAALVAASAPLWATALLDTHAVALTASLAVAVVAYAGHSGVLGALAGLRSWPTTAWLLASESLVRLLGVAVAAAVVGVALGLQVASAAAAVTWLVVVAVLPLARRAAGARGEGTAPLQARRMLTAMIASSASAALVVGYPTILRASTSPEVWATAAPLVLAISMTRAPLLMPLTAFQGFAISHFLEQRHRGMAALLPVLGGIAAVASVGALAAALVGPWLMTAIFGPAYEVSSALLAVLTLAGGSLALLTISGSAVIAVGRHSWYAAGWVLAAVGAGALLLLDLPLAVRTALSLAIGPVPGIALHLWALRPARERAS